MGKQGGGSLTLDGIIWINANIEFLKRRIPSLGDVGQRIEVTGGSIKTETGSRAVAQKKWIVKRTGLQRVNFFNLKEKVIDDCGNRGGKRQCFVDSGILKTEKYFPSRPGRVESHGKASFSMFINAEGKLVMKNEFQREAFQWTIETIAQRD